MAAAETKTTQGNECPAGINARTHTSRAAPASEQAGYNWKHRRGAQVTLGVEHARIRVKKVEEAAGAAVTQNRNPEGKRSESESTLHFPAARERPPPLWVACRDRRRWSRR